MKKLFLVCNAHIDPVWLWEYEEGLGTAITTFSQAADFLEEYPGFVFNHNESALYEFVEKTSPALFERIKRHVANGRWIIMGGWYIQPDVNMPSGESILRQIAVGQAYFKEKFGVSPHIAVNFDSFGHSRGLVQILQRTGYTGYVCCRRAASDPQGRDFVWRGYNNSEILLHRAIDFYCTLLGVAGEKVRNGIANMEKENRDEHILFWGVGNHGGGPSRKDLSDIDAVRREHPEVEIKHTSMDEYFEGLEKRRDSLPVMEESLKHIFQGCYTSQIGIKKLHQKLENELYVAEKMCAHASYYGSEYPADELRQIEKKLLFCEFHDILPGTSVKEGEQDALQKLNYGLSLARDLKYHAFIALTRGQARADAGEYPIFVYNPHPFEVDATMVCELNLENQNWLPQIYVPEIKQGGTVIPSQLEKPSANMNLDWRKRIVFRAKLASSAMNRFSCRFSLADPVEREKDLPLTFTSGSNMFAIDPQTGLIDRWVHNGHEAILPGSARLAVYDYCGDPWGFHYEDYKTKCGEFHLMPAEKMGDRFVAPDGKPVSIVEDGPVRTIVESYLEYHESWAIIRYIIPRDCEEIQVEYRLFNAEKDKILRMEFDLPQNGSLSGKTMFGVQEITQDGREQVFQDYVLYSQGGRTAGIINFGNYGVRAQGGTVSFGVVQPAAYAGHPIPNRPLTNTDRYIERIDQGMVDGMFVLTEGEAGYLEAHVESRSMALKQTAAPINFFPIKTEGEVTPMFLIDQHAVVVSACCRQGESLLVRLFNSTEKPVTFTISSAVLGISRELTLNGYEFKCFDATNDFSEADDLLIH